MCGVGGWSSGDGSTSELAAVEVSLLLDEELRTGDPSCAQAEVLPMLGGWAHLEQLAFHLLDWRNQNRIGKQ